MPNKSYVAFLRGINVGGNKQVKMSELQSLLESLGFTQVHTLLNSGNVVFDADVDEAKLKPVLESEFEQKFGFHSDMIVVPFSEIQSLVDADPFKDIPVDKDTRLYVTFLGSKPTSKLEIPYSSPGGEFRILSVTDRVVVSVLHLSPKIKTTELMKILEKEFGKNITTRNWNTVQKLVKVI